MINSKNKKWWNDNPMTYIDWELNKQERLVKKKEDFKALNKNYIETNPYLKKKFYKLSKKNFLKNKVSLDIGCGWGTSSIYLANFAKKLVAIDISENAIKGAKKNIKLNSKKKIILKRMDAEKLNFKKLYFDYIYSWGVIHHSQNPIKIYQNMYKVLKEGGEAFIMVYNKYSIRYYCLGLYYLVFKLKFLFGYNLNTVQKFFTDGYYHKHYSKNEIRQILKNIGFKNIRIEIDYMSARIFPGIRKNSNLDKFLKKRFGWFLIVRFKK